MISALARLLPADRRARTQLVLVVELAAVVVLALLQHYYGDKLVVVPWLSLAPLTASLVLWWAPTAVVALAAVGAVAFLSDRIGDLFTTQGWIRLAGSTALAGFAVLSSLIRTRREERIRRVTEVAAVAQATILHPVPVAVGGMTLASRYVSASADALVGGDLYDVVATPSGVRVVLGDARGKGLPAVQTAATVLSAFRAAAPRDGVSLEDLAREIEQTLQARLGAEDFVTAVLCELEPGGALTLVNCGHPQPLRLARGRAPETLGSWESPPLGLGVQPKAERFELGAGERLLLFTDGLVEARDGQGRFFALEPAADSALSPSPATTGAAGLEHALDTLMDQVREHVGGNLADDVAVLVVETPYSVSAAALSAGSAGVW
ncbi:stage II sporulation protein E [Motilibacter peucedani]|uniref:Stage II sporulation protein E n=1 Tax=Motilibacter peucedani TaxID=598650 RepID=A0A420XQQ3_9ACTN|nr:PP2C family protein-serine/threonine phosphatase [Motilibacter peucedani]RKS75623.1 stage II sporulation protein E [Motilibacter peucedani]